MLNYNTLQNRPREFLAATGLTLTEFEKLLPAFQAAYDKKYPPERTLDGQARQRRIGAGVKGKLPSAADKLLFILVYQKTNPLQTMHGLQFGLSQAQTNYWLHHLLPVLQQALAALASARRIAELTRKQLIPKLDTAHKSALALYRADQGTLSAVLEAEHRIHQARLDLLRSDTDAQTALAAIERLIGADL